MKSPQPDTSLTDQIFFFFIATFLFLFLSMILFEKTQATPLRFFLTFSSLLILLGYGLVQANKKIVSTTFIAIHPFTNWPNILATVISAVSTFYLSTSLHFSTVMSAAGIGIFGTLLLEILPLPYKKFKELALPLYCGTFIGMTAVTRIQSILLIGLAGIISGIIFNYAQNLYKGCGGKLGTIAFIGTALTIFIAGVLHV